MRQVSRRVTNESSHDARGLVALQNTRHRDQIGDSGNETEILRENETRIDTAVARRDARARTEPTDRTCNRQYRFAFRSLLLGRLRSDSDDGEFQRLARSVALQNTLHRSRPTPSHPLSNTNGILNRYPSSCALKRACAMLPPLPGTKSTA